jgi:hypothetical protein
MNLNRRNICTLAAPALSTLSSLTRKALAQAGGSSSPLKLGVGRRVNGIIDSSYQLIRRA